MGSVNGIERELSMPRSTFVRSVSLGDDLGRLRNTVEVFLSPPSPILLPTDSKLFLAPPPDISRVSTIPVPRAMRHTIPPPWLLRTVPAGPPAQRGTVAAGTAPETG